MNKILQYPLSYLTGQCVKKTHPFMILLLLTSLFAFPLQASETLENVNVSLALEDATVRHALNALEKQSEYKFFYRSDQVNTKRRVTLNFRGKMNEALRFILGDEIGYVISGKHIILEKKQRPVSVMLRGQDRENSPVDLFVSLPSNHMLGQRIRIPDLEISGVVTDDANAPLPGVNILLKGTTIGTTTDAMGMYKLSVPDASAVLVFSFIGYETVELPVGNRTTVNLALQPDMKALDEVVVVGYGSVKKSDLTGAVSSISKKDIGDRQVSDLASLIQGRAAGVDVSQGTIRIRGITSFNNTDPLVVIDGFIGGNLSTVNPNDIENIEILKDASSTAIYGSRGANGVILITTKSGKSGPMKLNLGYYEGISQVPKKLDVMNADQYTDYVLNLLSNSGMTPTPKLLSGETRVDRADWQDEIFRTSRNRELNLDFSGGSDNSSYFLGMGYRHNENPTFLGMETDNVYLRSKNTFTIKRWLRAGTNFGFSYNNYAGGGEAGNPGNLDHAIGSPAYFSVKDEMGNYTVSDRNVDMMQFANPITTAVHNRVMGHSLGYQAALWAEVEPLKGLTYKIQAGVSGDFARRQTSNDSYTGGIAGPATIATKLNKSDSYGFSPLIEQYITYKSTVGRHDFSAMVGNTWQNGAKGGALGVHGQGLDLSISRVLTAPTNLVTEDAIWQYAYLSYFGRINYQFNNKYLLTLNIRSDASPKFAPANRWGTFPSVAIAWKLHEEEFIMPLNVFDQLKLRVGWGLSGNDAIGDFRYLSQVHSNNVYYPFGSDGTRTNGATVLNNASANIKWESTETKSFGADMAFLNNSVTVSADYYIKETRDILYEVPSAVSLGYGNTGSSGSAVVNAASMENKGIELQVGYRSAIGELNYSLNANYTHNKNEVTSLGDGSYLDGINRTDIGNPIGYFYGYVADGIFMSQQEIDDANAAAQSKGFTHYQTGTTQAGDMRFVDVNGDGHVNEEDRTKIGSPHPTHIYGLNLSLDYKGFDFNVFVQGIGGSDIYDANYDRQRGGSDILNQFTYTLHRWQSESNPGNGIVPRSVIGDPSQNNRASTLKLTDGDYLKVRQLSIGYSLSNAFANRLGLSKLRFYCSAYNYFTFDKWHYGFDPEVGGSNLFRGRDGGNYWPKPKMLMLGFQVQL